MSRTRPDADPRPDRRPVLRLRPAYDRRQRAGAARPPRRRPAARHGVIDGAGDPVPDALLEIWQADADGVGRRSSQGSLRRDGCTFTGWGRAATDGDGHYSFTTCDPGPTEAGAAPFFALTRLRPRPAQPALHPRLPARRRGGAGRRPAARRRCPRTAAATLVAARGRARAPLRHPAAGRAARPSSCAYPGH